MFRAVFVSDVHIKSEDEGVGKRFLNWLERLRSPENLSHLFLVGDIFDLWISDHFFFRKKYSRIIEELTRLKSEGCEIHYFEGNHDLYLQDFFQRSLEVFVHRDAQYFHFPPWIVRVEHGDLMDPNDKGYLFLRWFLRTSIMESFARQAPARLVEWIGRTASQQSRHYTSTIKISTHQKSREVMQKHARQTYKQKKFDYLISGHVHVRDDHIVEDSNPPARFINLGSWFEDPKVFLLSLEHQGFVEPESIADRWQAKV